ncbi:FGGY-family carbohydrate kinase [Kangiella sediminilitoris]|uniref:Carbohydrate kinase n=1 Tax=Kangiella sediminilitoris TaxID=1144748 RepID=A0A1B3BDP5_9GAMM|nr:FGGY-family carbohydrate kinase [Kangiella sediminilitoris]AOE50954.1 carbohydrate kinase [Kangiella sediminilitoris]
MSKTTILAIDNGTQSLRAIIFDLEGRILAKSQIPINNYLSEKPGWYEQHPQFFWDTLCLACKRLKESSPQAFNAIKAVAVTTLRNTVVNLDSEGEPLRPAIIWTDQRKLKNITPLEGYWKYLFKIAGLESTLHNFQSSCQAAWIAHHQPDIWAKTDKYLLLSGYLNYKLTSQFKDSTASQVSYIPFDYKRHQWAKSSDWKWQIAPLKPDQLPELVKPGDTIGYITGRAAQATGLEPGLPVIAAGSDKASEVLGSGCIDDHQACLSFGTTATINVTSQKYREPIRFIPPYPSSITNAYTLEFQIHRGYWMVSWFKEEFAQIEQQLSDKLGVSAEQILEESVSDIPPGSDGLILQPYWSPGVKVPGPEARGAIIGFKDTHTKAHVYHAILEGIAYSLREGMETIQKRTKHKVEHLYVSGGGSQSDASMQLTADIFNLPATRPHTYETSALGAAINAAVGVNLYPDYPAAVKAMCREGKTFYPNPDNVAEYEQLYSKIYKRMYKRLKPLYKALLLKS